MKSRSLLKLARSSTLCGSQASGFIEPLFRTIASSQRRRPYSSDSSYATPAGQLNQDVSLEEKRDYDERVTDALKKRQIRTPWTREGSDKPPVATQRSAGAMSKGKLLTTPSRMLKLILPLTTQDHNDDRKDVEPLVLLVHPQQPLSYLERLIQSEIPMITENNKQRAPQIHFFAEDSIQDDDEGAGRNETSDREAQEQTLEETDNSKAKLDHDADTEVIDGKAIQSGKVSDDAEEEAASMRGGPGEGGVESYSGLGHEASAGSGRETKFVRWSPSTEIGDFIRDAARGQEFSVQIEQAPADIRVGVPSFNDRTYYLRMRLRKKSRDIAQMADLKKECDKLAHKSAQNVALGGFAILCGWWYLVYRLTFETDLGWDVMEPVTYLVGLSTLIGGYVWFLYHNREVSYRSAMNFTVSRRQSKLYEVKGFDVRKWESLIEEGNALRKEIKLVAQEYDVDWDEMKDEGDEKVKEALKKERQQKDKTKDKKDEEDEDKD